MLVGNLLRQGQLRRQGQRRTGLLFARDSQQEFSLILPEEGICYFEGVLCRGRATRNRDACALSHDLYPKEFRTELWPG